MDHSTDSSPGNKTLPERFTLILEDLHRLDPRPAVIKLRSLLKIARRGMGLKCISIVAGDGSEVQQ